MEYYDLHNTGPEVQERIDLVPVTQIQLNQEINNRIEGDRLLREALDQEILDRIAGDQRVLAESKAYCDIETSRAMQVEANLQAQIDAIIGSRLTITVAKDVSTIYVGVPTTITFQIGTSMEVSSCKLMRGDVEVACSDVPGSNYTFEDTLTVASDIGHVMYSVVAVLGGIERIYNFDVNVEKQTPTFRWQPSGDVTVVYGDVSPSAFPTLVDIPAGLSVVYSSTNPSVATVSSSGVVTVHGVGACSIKAESASTDVYKAKTVSYGVTVRVAENAQYYAGWSKGTSFDDFAAMTAEQLVAICEPPFNKIIDPTYEKNVTQTDVSGVTREIFVLMWMANAEPTGGTIVSSGITQQLFAEDFYDTNVFNATHNEVVISGNAFHVAGIRAGFGAGDSFTINFR